MITLGEEEFGGKSELPRRPCELVNTDGSMGLWDGLRLGERPGEASYKKKFNLKIQLEEKFLLLFVGQ